MENQLRTDKVPYSSSRVVKVVFEDIREVPETSDVMVIGNEIWVIPDERIVERVCVD